MVKKRTNQTLKSEEDSSVEKEPQPEPKPLEKKKIEQVTSKNYLFFFVQIVMS
jgi:hypothetical protein